MKPTSALQALDSPFRRAREVDHEGRADSPCLGSGQSGHRRGFEAACDHGVNQARGLALQHAPRCLRSDIAQPETGAAAGHDEVCSRTCPRYRPGDDVALVGHEVSRHFEPGPDEQTLEGLP